MNQVKPISSLSIALCTFNGAEFLESQLESLVGQDKLPLELVIQDDDSTDSTWQILEIFAIQAPFPTRIQRNTYRVGFRQNFSRAIARCQGDIIALCDQDDVWLPNKITKIMNMFKAPEIGLVFTNAEVVDQALHSLGYDAWQNVNFRKKEMELVYNRQETAVLLKHCIVTGATLAFRAKFKPLVVPIPQNWNHDAWIALLIAAVSHIWPLSEKLILYRQHSSNAIGGIKRNLITQIKKGLVIDRDQYYETELARYKQLYQRLISHPEFHPKQDALNQIEAKIRHLEIRAFLPRDRLKRLPIVLREYLSGNYARFARNWGSIMLDLLIK